MLITEVWKLYGTTNFFSSLNYKKGNISPYIRKGVLTHYHYHSDPKLGSGIVVIIRITCSYQYCTTILCLNWDLKIKESVNQPRYGRVYNCKYSQIIGCHNNWIIIIFSDDETYKIVLNTSIKQFLMVMWWAFLW